MRTILTTIHSKYIHNSLALPCLAAYCSDDCGEILIREFTTHEPRESVLALLLIESPDVVAFSVYLWNRRETLDLVDALSVAQPDLKIVLGGPEVSFEDQGLLDKHTGISALIRGEGEQPLRSLLSAWEKGLQASEVPRTTIRNETRYFHGPDSMPLVNLDSIPSPFQLGLTDINRGLVYYETSRGCPFRCSFCLSARDNNIRSFSTSRIQSDLKLMIDNDVAKVKLVDRTFNYDPGRARDIFKFIFMHNRTTNFHFEIGGHLLDEETLDLLAKAPKGLYQFEIGVQTTLESTLNTIDRKINYNKLEENIRRLVADDRIHIHLDLIAGLPGDSFDSFIASIDRVISLRPHHLQIEPVKLLPGSPLREQAKERNICFDPNPPYTILGSPGFSYNELQKITDISRLLDLTYNSGSFCNFLWELADVKGTFATGLVWLTEEWRNLNLFRFPINRQSVFSNLARIVRTKGTNGSRKKIIDSLAYDYALCERVIPSRIPDFFNTELSNEEQDMAKQIVQKRTEQILGQGIKLQYFTCKLKTHDKPVRLFLYLTQTGKKMQVEEYVIN